MIKLPDYLAMFFWHGWIQLKILIHNTGTRTIWPTSATGIADLTQAALLQAVLSPESARNKLWFADQCGLIVTTRDALPSHNLWKAISNFKVITNSVLLTSSFRKGPPSSPSDDFYAGLRLLQQTLRHIQRSSINLAMNGHSNKHKKRSQRGGLYRLDEIAIDI